MEYLERKINVFKPNYIEPLYVVQGSNMLSIKITFADWDIPTGATVKWQVITSTKGELNNATFEDNTVLIVPYNTTFSEAGKGYLQLRVEKDGKVLVSFAIDVYIFRDRLISPVEGSNSDVVKVLVDQYVEEATDGLIDQVETEVQRVIESIPSDYSTLSNEVSDVKDAIESSGNVPVSKSPTWIDGYVNNAGQIRSSAQSKTGLVPLKRGETVTVGTTNSNITIIGFTEANSIAVGDTVKILQRTTTSGQFETYSYTAVSDINIVICVLKANYTLKFTSPTYIQKELESLSNKVLEEGVRAELPSAQYTVTQNSSIPAEATRVYVRLDVGETIAFSVDATNDCITKYYFYINGSSDYKDYLPNTEYKVTATSQIKNIGFYINSSFIVANGTVTTNVAKLNVNNDSIEAKLNAVYDVFDYVPSGIVDGYVLTRPTANGSFFGGSGVTTGATNRIRTELIAIKEKDKIVISNGSFEHSVGMWNGTPSGSTIIRNDSQWITTNETIEVPTDGYIVIVFRKSDNSNIFPSDFDGEINLYNTIAYHASLGEQSYDIPDYYFANDYLSAKAARINALGKVADDVFIFITDVHWELNAKHSPALIKYLSDNCKIARLFDGGDLANGIIKQAIDAYRDAYSGRIYRVCGNHDWFTPEDGKSLYYWLDSDNYDQIGNAFEHYWYVDNVQQKIRYITLNSMKHSGNDNTSGWEYGFDADVINWFTNEALNVPNGYDVIVFAHWFRNRSGGLTGSAAIESAIASFNANTSEHGRVICIFQGHAHWDAIFHTSSGVPVITTTCDKYDISNEPELAEEVRTLGTINEHAFEVCILNREAKTITCVRIGALAQNNIDVGRTDTGFTFAQTLEERVISYD